MDPDASVGRGAEGRRCRVDGGGVPAGGTIFLDRCRSVWGFDVFRGLLRVLGVHRHDKIKCLLSNNRLFAKLIHTKMQTLSQ